MPGCEAVDQNKQLGRSLEWCGESFEGECEDFAFQGEAMEVFNRGIRDVITSFYRYTVVAVLHG